MVKKFIDEVDEQSSQVHERYTKNPQMVISRLQELHKEMQREEQASKE